MNSGITEILEDMITVLDSIADVIENISNELDDTDDNNRCVISGIRTRIFVIGNKIKAIKERPQHWLEQRKERLEKENGKK